MSLHQVMSAANHLFLKTRTVIYFINEDTLSHCRSKALTRARPGVESLEDRKLMATQGVLPLPVSPATSISLHVAKSSSPAGDLVDVTQSRVLLKGQATPGAVVKLGRILASGKEEILARANANAEGNFYFRISVAMGTTSLVARAGSTFSTTLEVNRVNQAIAWNSVALQAVRTAHLQAPDASRDYAIVALSVFDAVDAVSPRYAPFALKAATAPGASASAAAAAAAHSALVGLFPHQKEMLDAEWQASEESIPAGPPRKKGIVIGATIAGKILSLRSNDGADSKVAYAPTPGPDVWTPTPPAYAPPVDPQWGQVKPFALASGSQFQPSAPPAADSPAFAADVNQVESVGGTDSTVRTADQTALARFWSDLAGTFDPPGHWNQITEIAAIAKHSGLLQSARSLALVNMALADAGIEAWGVKYEYDTPRPVSVIRDGLDGINPLVTAEPEWTPLWSTPAFPSYISGHSTFSAAAATVLDALYGNHFAFTDEGDPSLGLTPRSFTSFDSAAQEAGISRVYGGIHYESDNLGGLLVGGEVGHYVVDHELHPLNR